MHVFRLDDQPLFIPSELRSALETAIAADPSLADTDLRHSRFSRPRLHGRQRDSSALFSWCELRLRGKPMRSIQNHLRTSPILVGLLLIACGGSVAPPASNGATDLQKKERDRRDAVTSVAPVVRRDGPPPTRRQDVVDVYHGIKVVDPYRWIESPSAERDEWFKAQDAYARRVLHGLPGREKLRDQLREANREVEQVEVLTVIGERPQIFALRRGATDETAKLVVRDGWAGTDRVLMDPSKRRDGGSHVAIDFAAPSPDGRYVVYAVSPAGSEEATLEIVEVASGKILPDRIDRMQVLWLSWRPDGRSFFYWRRVKQPPGAPLSDWYKDSASYLHIIGDDPNAALQVFGPGIPQLGVGPYDYTRMTTARRSRWVLAEAAPGAEDSAYFVAPLARVKPGATRWRRVVSADDKVPLAAALIHGDRVYVRTYSDAPNYRIVSFDATSGAMATAKEFLATSDLVLQDFVGARDAMYAVALDRGTHRLLRVPWNTAIREEVALPFQGTIRDLVADPGRPGLVFSMEGWTHRPGWFEVDMRKRVRALPIVSARAAVHGIMTEEATAVSRDGAEVPLSIVRRQSLALDGKAPAMLNGYGQYAMTTTPHYDPFLLTWVRQGGMYAVCHVRGGGARGKSWHLDGIRQKKENGVDDFIACAEYLIKKGYTASTRLTVTGRSAGGIVVGGAITKRPELFKAAVLQVAQLGLLRDDAGKGGNTHHVEYGNPGIAADFHSMLASDPYHRVRDGIDYPAALVTAGLQDQRVDVGVPAKFAARLQAASQARPTLLRVEFDAGHGIGSTETQREEEFADIYSFALWQARVDVK